MFSTPNAPPAENDETSWEAAARSLWGAYLTEIEGRALLEASALAGSPGTALEVGCDGGRWSMVLHGLGWSNVCTDIAPESVERSRRRLPGAKCVLVQALDERLPVENESIDLLLVCEVPPVTEAAWFPAEARRVLRRDGVLVFSHHNSRSYRGLAYRAARKLQILWRGNRLKSYFYNGPAYGSLRRALVDLGFEIVREEGFCWFPFGRRSNSRLIAPAARMESLLGLRRMAALSPWVMSIALLRPPFPENPGRTGFHRRKGPEAVL
jgi:SAM-dependent methyltransferase